MSKSANSAVLNENADPDDDAHVGWQPPTSTAECKANALLAAMSIKADLWVQNATNAEIEAMLKGG